MKNMMFIVLAVSAISGCSKYKEQCHTVVLAGTEMHNIEVEMRDAARAGNRANFDKAKADLAAATSKLAATEVTGDGLKEEALASMRSEMLRGAEEVPKVLDALVTAMEKDPKGAAKEIAAVGELSTYFATGTTLSKMACE